MKSFFTKLSVLLFGVAFAVAGCQDYDEDIRKVNDQLNANTAELTSITDALDKAIKDLEAKMVADYATKKALADLSAELKAEIDADVAAAKTALEAAYKAADAVLKSGYEAADAALKAELQKAIADAKAEANTAVQNLQKALENAQAQMQQGLKDANDYTAMLEQYVMAEFQKVNKAITDLNKTVGDLDAAYKAADAGLQKNIDAAIAKAAADLLAAKTELTAAYEAAIKTAVDKLQAEITKNSEAIAALTTLHKNDVALLQAAIALGDEDVMRALNLTKAQLQDHIADYKATVDQLQAAMGEADEEVKRQLTNALNAHIEVYETTVDQLQGAMAQGDEAVRQELKNALNALDELHKADVANLQGAIAENTTLAEGIRTQLINHIAEYKATIEDLENQVTANEGEITMLKVRTLAVEGQVEALQALHATDMENMQNVLNNLEVAIQQETAQRQAAIEELDAKHTLANEEILAYVGELEHQIRLNAAAIKNINDVNAAQDKAIEDLGKQLETLRKELKEYYALKTDVTTTKEELNKLVAKVAQLEKDVLAKISDINSRVNQNTEDLKKAIEAIAGLTEDVNTIAARIQSIVYVPEYSDGKANINYAIVPSIANDNETVEEVAVNAFIPTKSTLRFKVNSTSETAVADLVEAYEADPTILSFDLEGVTVRGASAGDAVLEIVGVSEDEDGYLAVEVLAKNFDPEFYLSTLACMFEKEMEFGPLDDEDAQMWKEHLQGVWQYATQYPGTQGYSAALVLNQADEKTNVASEFTNLIAAEDFEVIRLVVEAVIDEDEFELIDGDVDLVAMEPYTRKQYIASNDATAVYTTPSTPYIEVMGDEKLYTADELYEEYGIKAEIEQHQYVVSYTKAGKIDSNITFGDLCWEDSIVLYNKANFNVVDPNAVGTSREVTLPACADQDGYNNRVGAYIEVVDSYFLGGQAVAVADYVEITKNIVRINFEEVVYDWTLQKALDLRAEDGTPYGNEIVIEGVEYDNIYDLKPLLNSEKTEIVSNSLNGKNSASIIKVTEIAGPKDGKNGTGTVVIKPGYEFAAATAENGNKYVKVWKSELSETTDAIVTVTIVLGNYPGLVTVESEVELELVAGKTWFDGKDALIEDAYAEFGAENAGFAEDAKVNDLMFAALTDEANTIVNDPNSLYNMNFVVNENVDNSWVRLYETQIEDNANVAESYVFTRDITTWFGVPFKFIVTGKPQLPEVELVRSTEYANATDTEKVYAVQLDARVIGGVYTVKQSDLGFYLNTIGEANDTQRVTFAVVEGDASIANQTVNVEPLEAPITNPLVGDITAYLQKEKAILTWNDKGTQVKVKATLWAGAYPIDYATLILTVEDPIKFVAKNITKERVVEDVTVAKVFEGFELYSTAKAADGKPAFVKTNLVKTDAADLTSILPADVVTAFGITMKTEMVTMYEKVGEGENDKVLYDSSKYVWEPEKGILTLKKDDAAKLLNPIVAQIRVTFTHNVHGASDACSVSKDIFVTFQQTK